MIDDLIKQICVAKHKLTATTITNNNNNLVGISSPVTQTGRHITWSRSTVQSLVMSNSLPVVRRRTVKKKKTGSPPYYNSSCSELPEQRVTATAPLVLSQFKQHIITHVDVS